jgi:hypothetical protein
MNPIYQEQGTFLGWWDLEGLVGTLLECADQLSHFNNEYGDLTELINRTRIMANDISPRITERIVNGIRATN